MITHSQKKWIILAVTVVLIGSFIFINSLSDRTGGKNEDQDFRKRPVSDTFLQFTAKERALQDVIKESPNNPQLMSQLGDLYFENGRFEQAINEYRKVLELDPSDGDTYNDLGLALHYTGKTDAALQTLRKGTEVAQSYQRVWLSLGFVLASSGGQEEAKEVLQKAADMAPDTDVGREAKRIIGLLK